MLKSFTQHLAEATKDNNGKIKIVAIQGSPRTHKSCSGGDSKTELLLNHALDNITKDIQVTTINLSVLDDQPQVRPCKGCISTSNGFHCHFPCTCYAKGDGTNDLMHEEDVYQKLQDAHGFIVFTPVHWYAPSSQVKAFFDRLVCANLTLTAKDAKKLTNNQMKDPKVTIALERSIKHKELLKNHLEGKVAAFFIHGDDGANDYMHNRMPLSMTEMKGEYYISPKQAIMPIVNQCRYSGIFVPENCISAHVFGHHKPYSVNNVDVKNSPLLDQAVQTLSNLVTEIKKRKS